MLSLGLTIAMALTGAAQNAPDGVSTTPAATVAGNSVVNAGEKVTVHVPTAATYVGGERFNLYGVADAEVHVFVEADAAKRMVKLYWIQFESYLPAKPELSYNYAEGNRRMTLWGTPTWVRAGPAAAKGPTRAGSDREHVIGILKRAGYDIPAEVMNVRMVQMLDDPTGTGKGRKELMIIYSEDLAPTGLTIAQLASDGPTGSRWKAMEQPLIDRASAAASVERE